MTKLTGIITSESKLEGSLGVRNEINVSIIGTGARGKEGKSAYESWLDLGNEGTEQEYLASLKGQDGYTPIKRIDYMTVEDINMIKEDLQLEIATIEDIKRLF